MTVTTGLSAVEALTKAKNEGGFATFGICKHRWEWENAYFRKTEKFFVRGEEQWRNISEWDVNPIWILRDDWEHHLTADTL